MLRAALDGRRLAYHEVEGEAAFYGPKIDLQVTDPHGRQETLSTIQVDYALPARFALSFPRGPARETPVMIHRSIVSTMERMVAHLLEVHDGALPVWLAPTQVVVLAVSDEALGHAVGVLEALRRAGVRVELDDRDATLAARVRDARLPRRPVPLRGGSPGGRGPQRVGPPPGWRGSGDAGARVVCPPGWGGGEQAARRPATRGTSEVTVTRGSPHDVAHVTMLLARDSLGSRRRHRAHHVGHVDAEARQRSDLLGVPEGESRRRSRPASSQVGQGWARCPRHCRPTR